MKKSLELKESRSALVETLESIKNTAEGESRNLNEAETIEVDNTLSSIDTLDTQIERAERVEKELRTAASVSGVKVTPTQDKDLGKFTFQGAVRAAYSGKVEGVYKEMHDEAINEARYTGTTIKGYGIPASVLTRAWSTASVNNVEAMSFTDQLEKNLVLSSAGANTYFGINDMKFPVFSGISSTWVSEDGSSGAASSAGDLTAVTLTPKKLISVVNMSSESMMQNPSLEANLQRNMAQQLAAALEYAVLDTGDVSNAPASIFADATAGPTAVTAGDWVEMETDALALGVQREGARMAYLLDMDAYKTVKTLAQVASVSPIWDNADRRLNGYYAFQSGNVAASGTSAKAHALFGDFSKVHIAQFGGLDILFDPYTEAAKGLPRMVVTSLVDADATQNDSFIKLIEA
tara:strand:- start:8648 stop:9865 length:1218 start_codon:yes stop_codon:yes gene_type:complete